MEIKLISVDKKLIKYLKFFDVNSVDKLTLDQGNKFFVEVIKDFKNGKLTLDELSVFGSILFHGVAKTKRGRSDLFVASLSAMDLAFEIRNVYDNVPQHMRDIDEFFEKYKS